MIALYRDHATSEQFHSEFKTDLDIERLPSGKFATNALVMILATFQLQYAALDRFDQFGGGHQSSAASRQTPALENCDPGIDVSRRPID